MKNEKMTRNGLVDIAEGMALAVLIVVTYGLACLITQPQLSGEADWAIAEEAQFPATGAAE